MDIDILEREERVQIKKEQLQTPREANIIVCARVERVMGLEG